MSRIDHVISNVYKVEASESKRANPDKNPNQGGSRHKCVKDFLSCSYVKLMHC